MIPIKAGATSGQSKPQAKMVTMKARSNFEIPIGFITVFFKIPIGFHSAPTVPHQCPNSAPSVPHDNALTDSLCKFRTRKQFRSNGGSRREKYLFHLNISFVTHACLYTMRNLYGALSLGTVGALLGHCQGTVRGTVPFL